MLVPADNASGWSLLRVEGTQNLLLANIHRMTPRIGYCIGHLVNYDPRTSFILAEGPIKIGSLEQFALRRGGIDYPVRSARAARR